MRDWLLEQGVTIAAMKLTSTYWKAPLYCLEDVMAQLFERGLLQPSIAPPPAIRSGSCGC